MGRGKVNAIGVLSTKCIQPITKTSTIVPKISRLFKEFATYRAIAEYVAVILCYMKKHKMTPHQYADNLVVIFCKVFNVYDKGTLNSVFFEEVEASIRYSRLHYWAQNPKADLTEVAFLA